MSSAICQNFVQNAWKKELCSNCFKSKDEHAQKAKPKPIKLVSNSQVEGIMKIAGKSTKSKRSVCFRKELTEIIGFGGEDWESDLEDSREDSESSEDDFIIESEEEDAQKELKRITKENTDFNTVNLKDEIPIPKKNISSLLLGKPIVDSNGKKQTLLVSVTPFGEDTPPSPKRFIKTISHIPISKTVNRENVPDTKTNVILTSYTKNNDDTTKKEEKSLLDEISETLENGKHPIQIISRKKTQKEIILTTSNKENTPVPPIIEKPKITSTERKSTLSRTPALKRDLDKPIYQTSTAKIELINTKNKKLLEEEQTPPPLPEKEKVIGLPPITPPKVVVPPRELAGEPDGRADPEIIEPPALPLSLPPSLDGQNSFLHNSPIYDKPKIPCKPIVRKTPSPIILKTSSPIVLIDEGKDSLRCKRRAPKPPEELYTLRERASSCNREVKSEEIPEIIQRKLFSISTDSLTSCEEKKKEKSKGRFSLKKFLRMGGKDPIKINVEIPVKLETGEPPLSPKPRLVIIHPSELNGSRVEVVKPRDQVDCETVFEEIKQKPPPPPRNLDDYKPNLPHPPKSVEIINKQKQIHNSSLERKKVETVYANIGEVRSAMVPNKPQRTASMREREALAQKQLKQSPASNYEPINVDENVYDYINSGRSSSPDSADSSPHKNSPIINNKIIRLNKRSESSIDVSGDYFKFGNIPRSLSLTYCGSETESEIYSPYGFYGSESEVRSIKDWNIDTIVVF